MPERIPDIYSFILFSSDNWIKTTHTFIAFLQTKLFCNDKHHECNVLEHADQCFSKSLNDS